MNLKSEVRFENTTAQNIIRSYKSEQRSPGKKGHHIP
jgi:hypothetical protein